MNQIAEIDSHAAPLASGPHDEFAAKIDYTIDRAQRSLLALQHPEGYWHGALEANAEMNAEFIIFNRFMDVVDPELEAKLKKHLLDTPAARRKLEPVSGRRGRPVDTDRGLLRAQADRHARRRRADDAGAPLDPRPRRNRRARARSRVSTSRRWARCRGTATAAMPVELILLPNWFPVNIYELSSWARGTVCRR